jgi:hypothetical protein
VTTDEDGGAGIGWLRAILSGVGLVAAGLAVAVGGSNYVLTDVTSVDRDVREYIASAVFFVAVIVLAFVLRRLQRRRLI